ncbi:hypothetical protein T265_12381 [Opisthorchis viverrini]|uniref:Uncharacterized protein n=1 Tax=Opisthorchis viverrini TaxID=6198 RepID=A0A074ZS04_OPIVI|nr:hypothetical protein T265_12381 [Opisthorchis viverrini]KER18089.1 hypothetical protein T265_12381 [Opisthorchis viverrini]
MNTARALSLLSTLTQEIFPANDGGPRKPDGRDSLVAGKNLCASPTALSQSHRRLTSDWILRVGTIIHPECFLGMLHDWSNTRPRE